MFRAELRKKMVRPEQSGTGCSDRLQTIQTVTAGCIPVVVTAIYGFSGGRGSCRA